MKKSRGSAIVIAVLLITAIGAIAFTFGRVLYLELANASLYENGVGAYYAAESGVEEGFLRYRFEANRNPMVPFTGQNDIANAGNVFRSTLTGCDSNCIQMGGSTLVQQIGINKAGTLIDLDDAKQVYDLRMNSKGSNFAGEDANGDSNVNLNDLDSIVSGSPYYVARDDSKKIDMGDIFTANKNLDVNLYFRPAGIPALPAPLNTLACTLIEAKIVGQEADGTVEEKKVLLKNQDISCNYSGVIKSDTGVVPYALVGGTDYYSIANLKAKFAPTVPYTKSSLYLKPVGADMAFMLQEVNSGSFDQALIDANPLFAANVDILSTGYYGGVARTLRANIDRQSGTLYDLFDYVIYQIQ